MQAETASATASLGSLVLVTGQRPAAMPGRRIGEILVEAGKLQEEDVQAILTYQSEKSIRFGEAAVQMGLVTETDVRHALSRQFDFPYLAPGSSQVSEEVVTAYQPFGRRAEAVRALRGEITARWLTHETGGRSLAIVSPDRGEGRSYVTANLAVAFAQLGKRTLLIDADMRNPRQHLMFGLDSQSGLSAVLTGRGEASSVRQVAPFENLCILPAGVLPPNPQELLVRPDFEWLLREVEKNFEVILVDTPPGAHFADAQAVSVSTRGALMVVRKDVTRPKAVAALGEKIAGNKARVIGSVMNEV
jgi:chain length determinant protein tyrosine kinase EpsG